MLADAATPDGCAHPTAPSPPPLVAANVRGDWTPVSLGTFANTAGPANTPAGPASNPSHAASGPVDHQGNRAVAQVDNDDLPAGNQKAKLIQLRRSIQHDLREIVELHVIGNVRAER